ncbi:MAG: hypothetical protein P1U68_18445 [Verrucomicrobiales bacterium]|nr:hypothetical protein [Verrucomicrobiales bacterium]MDF2378179.1 hypothetical protein [Verrucomicrobiales bacterium]
MSVIKLSEFIFRFTLSAADMATWIYVVLVALFLIFAVGLGWGKLWNRQWSLSRHFGNLFLVIVFAITAAFAVLNLRGISRVEGWFDEQKNSLAKTISSSAKFNRDVLKATWQELSASGGQSGLTPPDEAGNELRLNSPEEAHALAINAAEETRSALRLRLPFSLGVSLSTQSPEEIATETADAIKYDVSSYPTIVTASNEWTTTAATLQTNHALDAAWNGINGINARTGDLKTACLWLLLASFAIPLFTIPFAALNDIKINPKG